MRLILADLHAPVRNRLYKTVTRARCAYTGVIERSNHRTDLRSNDASALRGSAFFTRPDPAPQVSKGEKNTCLRWTLCLLNADQVFCRCSASRRHPRRQGYGLLPRLLSALGKTFSA